MKEKIKRPSLLWLSREDVRRVRNQIIQLYLAPDEVVEAAPPDRTWGVRFIHIRCSSSIPVFEFELRTAPDRRESIFFRYWLKVKDGVNPWWDRSFEGATEIVRYKFNAPECLIVSRLVKYYAAHFPFIATNNYLANNGQVIA